MPYPDSNGPSKYGFSLGGSDPSEAMLRQQAARKADLDKQTAPQRSRLIAKLTATRGLAIPVLRDFAQTIYGNRNFVYLPPIRRHVESDIVKEAFRNRREEQTRASRPTYDTYVPFEDIDKWYIKNFEVWHHVGGNSLPSNPRVIGENIHDTNAVVFSYFDLDGYTKLEVRAPGNPERTQYLTPLRELAEVLGRITGIAAEFEGSTPDEGGRDIYYYE